MKIVIKPVVWKSLAIGGLAVLLLLLWNIPLLISVSRPVVKEMLHGDDTAIAAPQLDPSVPQFSYPRLDISAPLKVSAKSSPLNFQDWDSIRSALKDGVSLNFSTEKLGEAPLAYVTGHSSDRYPHTYSSVFAPLGQAKVGDSFYLTAEDKIWQYEVKTVQVLQPTSSKDFSAATLTASMDQTRPHVALVTCWPLFTSLRRMVIVGELVSLYGSPS